MYIRLFLTERMEVSLSPISLFCTDSEGIMRRADLESCRVLLPCNMCTDGKEEMPWKEGVESSVVMHRIV